MEHDGCKNCKYELEPETSVHCTGCKQNAIDKYTPMTNADKIRSMTEEELIKFIKGFETCNLAYCRAKTCNECLKIWLREKVE